MLAGGQGHDKLFDECGDIAVGDDLALPLLDGEDGCGHLNAHVLLHLHLTSQAPSLLDFLAGEMDSFGGENLAAAAEHADTALAAAAFSAAGAGQEDVLGSQRGQQRAAGLGRNLGLIVDGDDHIAALDHELLGNQEHGHKQQCDDEEYGHAGDHGEGGGGCRDY